MCLSALVLFDLVHLRFNLMRCFSKEVQIQFNICGWGTESDQVFSRFYEAHKVRCSCSWEPSSFAARKSEGNSRRQGNGRE